MVTAHDAQQLFRTHFGVKPTGVWSAPGRVNLIGEHVDYAGGVSLPFALSQRTYIAAAVATEPSAPPVYDLVSRFGAETIAATIPTNAIGPGHPSDWSGYVVGTIWAAIESGVIDTAAAQPRGLRMAVVSDVPVGAGLSSSAALECSAGLAAWELLTPGALGTQAPEEIRRRLMEAAIRAENEVVGASTGGLDQRISLLGAPGQALAIDFLTDSDTPIPFAIDDAGLVILIIDTNAPHSLADGQYAARRAIIDGVTADLGVASVREVDGAVEQSARWAEANVPDGTDPEQWRRTVARRIRHVVTEIARTEAAIEQLRAGDFLGFGQSMIASHASLRDDYEVTVPQLDVAVDEALAAGALGARMTGGGFGGSAIALVQRDRVDAVRTRVAEEFAERGFDAPDFFVATPSAGAHRDL